MIKRSKQNWSVGQQVKVGFLVLTVVAAISTPGDGLPDAYILSSKSAFYEFVPHNGLNKLSHSEAGKRIEQGVQAARRLTLDVITKASDQSLHTVLMASLVSLQGAHQ